MGGRESRPDGVEEPAGGEAAGAPADPTTLKGHNGPVLSVAIHPDGRWALSGSSDSTLRLWSLKTGGHLGVVGLHTGMVFAVAIHPDAKRALSGSGRGTLKLWNLETGRCLATLKGHDSAVTSVAIHPDGRMAMSASLDGTLKLWHLESRRCLATFKGHTGPVGSVTIHPGGRRALSGSDDGTLKLWDLDAGSCLATLKAHSSSVESVAIHQDWRRALSGSEDATLKLWDLDTARCLTTLEGHTDSVQSVAFHPDGRRALSGSDDRTLKLWDLGTGGCLATLEGHPGRVKSLAIQADGRRAISGSEDATLKLWELTPYLEPNAVPAPPAVRYTSARVALAGDSGVGKSGLGLVLSGLPWIPTESTHGRFVYTMDSRVEELGDRVTAIRETLLWDLAGQPGYRLVHQLHLGGVQVALVVFDAKSETDPFAGVRYWDRALRQARRAGGDETLLVKLLVAARMDRGGIGASDERIARLREELGFDGYYPTSAKEGRGIAELAAAIRDAIDWAGLPPVVSNDLFQRLKAFLLEEKQAGRLLCTSEDLYRSYLQANPEEAASGDLRASFEACIGRVEDGGLIRRLRFGDLALMQPELLDAYASALVNAAKEEPDGLGHIAEADAEAGRFAIPMEARIANAEQEKLLLLATVEDLLRHEIALREQTEEGPFLVFPTELRLEHPDLPNPPGKAAAYGFEGAVTSVYATLAVRLAHSGRYPDRKLWKNAAVYVSRAGGRCGIAMTEPKEGRGELTVFYEDSPSAQTRREFEAYVAAHLQRRAVPDSISERRVTACTQCGRIVPDRDLDECRESAQEFVFCAKCGATVPLKPSEAPAATSAVAEMDRAADATRDREAAVSVVAGKRAMGDFDVFLCHNSADKPAVKEVGNRLMERGLLPWLDEWEILAGDDWVDKLEEQIKSVKTAAVFVGPKGEGPWMNHERKAFLRKFVKGQCRIIPVILPAVRRKIPELPIFLQGLHWVDFRKEEPPPLEQLISGITGERAPFR